MLPDRLNNPTMWRTRRVSLAFYLRRVCCIAAGPGSSRILSLSLALAALSFFTGTSRADFVGDSRESLATHSFRFESCGQEAGLFGVFCEKLGSGSVGTSTNESAELKEGDGQSHNPRKPHLALLPGGMTDGCGSSNAPTSGSGAVAGVMILYKCSCLADFGCAGWVAAYVAPHLSPISADRLLDPPRNIA
jgi:hypothetical protein